MKVLYFAWLRERVGTGEEDVTPPAEVATVADLIAWLAGKGEHYAYAFENPKVVRAAIDQEHVKHSAAIAGAKEVAFFPPMTGG
jgi:molybdopterin synthase sulfur carrier subunit